VGTSKHQREYPMPVKRCSPHWSLQRRLAERSVRDPKTGCLLWTASLNASGYGYLFWKGVPQLAHRAAWLARHGPIRRASMSATAATCAPASIPIIFFSARRRTK
jgi:hypothetical protein